MWFEELTGFKETTPDEVRAKLHLSGSTLTSRVNGGSWNCGTLEVVSLNTLRERAESAARSGGLRVAQQVADVQKLHADSANTGALFQVASQFNLLEMVGPSVTPEQGVGIYELDFTQGPACAIAAGAGTIYRNYFAPTRDGTGQSATSQIDCLEDMGAALGNIGGRLWRMRNGYALPSLEGLREISRMLQGATEAERDRLRGLLKIGVQWQTQVTLPGCAHEVSQVYCSALPVAYCGHPADDWKELATLILEAAYEATLHAAVLNAQRTGNNTVYLTLLGGGAFGNEGSWILSAIERALQIHAHSALDVRLVSFQFPNPELEPLCTEN